MQRVKVGLILISDNWQAMAKAAGVAIGGFAFHHQIVQWLIFAMLADVVTGLIAGWYEKRLDSDVSFRGMCKKSMMIVLVLVGELITRAAQSEPALVSIGGGIHWDALIAGGFFVHELISIAENAGRVGIWMPKPLMDALKKVQTSNKDSGPGSAA